MSDVQLRAQMLLAEAEALGVELADLVAAGKPSSLPTLAAFIESIAPTFADATAATYWPYWRLAIVRFGDEPIAAVGLGDLHVVVSDAVARAKKNRANSTGRSSAETCIAALRAVFRRAIDSGLIRVNPAAALPRPTRVRSRRRALSDLELGEVIDAIRTTSTDPQLDLLLVRFHLETGARRGGAINLTVADLDDRRSTVWLREKNDSEREQPLSPTTMRLIRTHAAQRGGERGEGAVFWTKSGLPLTSRRYDAIFGRAQRLLPWAARTQVSAHVLRHTAITAVGRLAGYPVAQAFAGHVPSGTTGRYLYASLEEVAEAVAMLTGEPHPLAGVPRWDHSVGRCAMRLRKRWQ